MNDRIGILQLNVARRKEVQLSLLNDTHSASFSLLCVTEPYIYEHPTTRRPAVHQHHVWKTVTPATHNEEAQARHRFRAAIWVAEGVYYREEETGSPDVAAVVVKLEEANLLAISAYIPSGAGRVEDQESLEERLENIQQVISRVTARGRGITHIYVGGDFNRHNPVWGQEWVRDRGRRSEAWPILQFMLECQLQHSLPRGTITYSHYNGAGQTTIDLVLVSQELRDSIVQCQTSETDHGSDHRLIESIFQIRWSGRNPRPGRLMFNRADWTLIHAEAKTIHVEKDIRSAVELDQAAQAFGTRVQEILEKHVPRSKQHPHAKRWWTPALTDMRNTVSGLRNLATARTRQGISCPQLYRQLHSARGAYFHEMNKQKARHWKEFLHDPANIWKASAFAKKDGGCRDIPGLQNGERVAETDQDKAATLLAAFFPPQPDPENQRPTRAPKRGPLPHFDLTEEEIRGAIFRSNPKKAAGHDGIPFLAWQKLWPAVKEQIVELYRASVRLRHLPEPWRIARIIPLRKPGKPDYTKPKAYRPISLLQTLSKGLEAVIAKRLSYMAETHNLLPVNHFGARKQRSCEQAINILVEKIYTAWRRGKVLSLVTFDVQGAFNGVNRHVLQRRLRERRIPEELCEWVNDFCNKRSASLAIQSYESPVEAILHPGVPQGSPLSPILYIFYNAGLVDQPINAQGGSLGFVDDYSAWTVGNSAAENTEKLQREVIPRVEQWAKESGAVFEASKTGLIHFVRPQGKVEEDLPPLNFQVQVIVPSKTVKLLGVVLDNRMTFKQHIAKVTSKATNQCLAIKRLRGVRPKQARQLYTATVTPILDYCATAWYAPGRRGITSHVRELEAVQKLGALAVVSAFRTVALHIAQIEAGLVPTERRLQKRVLRHLARLLTLPEGNPVSGWVHKLPQQGQTFASPLAQTFRVHKAILTRDNGAAMETIHPELVPPWRNGCGREGYSIEIESDREAIIQRWRRHRKRHRDNTLFTDASLRNDRCGTAVIKAGSLEVLATKTWPAERVATPTVAELLAIKTALETLRPQARAHSSTKQYTVATDSQRALERIRAPRREPGQYIVHAILHELQRIENKQGHVTLLWVPGHAGITGNEKANQVARARTQPDTSHYRDQASEPIGRQGLSKRNQDTLYLSFRGTQKAIDKHFKELRSQPVMGAQSVGKYTWKLDGALPGPHTLGLYDALNDKEASILVQCRTNHSRLLTTLWRIRRADSNECQCGGGPETVKHVIYDCIRWRDRRQQAIREIGVRWRDLSYILGGWNAWCDPKTGKPVDGPREKWKANIAAVKALLRFLQDTGRFDAEITT